jgi:membrane protein
MAATRKRLMAALSLGGLSLKDAAIRTWDRMNEHEIMTRAAAITFSAIAALVPFLALMITLTAYLLPSPVRHEVRGKAGPADELVSMLPGDAASIVTKEIQRLQESPPAALISLGLAATIWLSSSVFVAIMDAMNRILGVRETRPWWKQRLVAMVMTLSQAAILIAVFSTMLAWPLILHFLGIGTAAALLVTAVHGVLVFLVILLTFALALYFAPNSDQCWEWITPGSLIGSVVLLVVSVIFRVYVQHWGNYSATYGSLGGIVLLMTWMWLCSLLFLTAAELNKVIKDASPLGGGCDPPPSRRDDRHADQEDDRHPASRSHTAGTVASD